MADEKTVKVVPTRGEITEALKYSHGSHPQVILTPTKDGKAYECPAPFAEWLCGTGDFQLAKEKKATTPKTDGGTD